MQKVPGAWASFCNSHLRRAPETHKGTRQRVRVGRKTWPDPDAWSGWSKVLKKSCWLSSDLPLQREDSKSSSNFQRVMKSWSWIWIWIYPGCMFISHFITENEAEFLRLLVTNHWERFHVPTWHLHVQSKVGRTQCCERHRDFVCKDPTCSSLLHLSCSVSGSISWPPAGGGVPRCAQV